MKEKLINDNISEDFIFKEVFRDKKTCKIFLKEIGINVEKIYGKIETQKHFKISKDYKEVIPDIFLQDSKSVIDLEMENENKDGKEGLQCRSVYYLARLNTIQVLSGKDYTDLKNTYIIFICRFDPFNERKYIYVKEDRFTDTRKNIRIFLNTKGKNKEGATEDLIALLHYIEHSDNIIVRENGSELLMTVAERLEKVKGSKEYMAYVLDKEKIATENAIRIAKKMLQKGIDNDCISECTDLSVELIKELREELEDEI